MHNECQRIRDNHRRDAIREAREEEYRQVVLALAAGDEVSRHRIDAALEASGREIGDLARDIEIAQHQAALTQLTRGW